MKIAVLTCGNAQEYLKAHILPYLEHADLEFAKHKGELEKKGDYDMVIVACYDVGFGERCISDLDAGGVPVADLRVLDLEHSREKALPEEMKKKVAEALFRCLLQTKSGNELLRSLMEISLSEKTE